MRFVIYLLCLLSILSGCSKDRAEVDPIAGWWRAELIIDSSGTRTVPFFLEITETNPSQWIAAIINGEERILHEDVQFRNDTLVITSPVFNSSIYAALNRNELSGYWVDRSRPGDYRLEFRAKYNLDHRFKFESPLQSDLDGTWKTLFNPGTSKPDTAIAEFRTDPDGALLGTFLTTTGDYRFLEGGFDGSSLKLSAFDGSHVFLFEAKYTGDTLNGVFYSGNHWQESFTCWRSSEVRLPDPYRITDILDSVNPFTLSTTDIHGGVVDLNSERYKDRPLIIQVMGSWCPNCMDETIFLSRNYDQIKERNVEVVSVAFERQHYEEAMPVLRRYQKNLQIPYTLVYGGSSAKDSSAKFFPQLSGISAYPTTLFLDSGHKIKKVHTGFSGPGTGRHHDEEIRKFWETVDEIKVPL